MVARQSNRTILTASLWAALLLLTPGTSQSQPPGINESRVPAGLWADVFELAPNQPTLFQWDADSAPRQPATDDSIVTDRPDFTEASSTVGKGVLQLEAGYTYAFDDDGLNQTINHSFPEALFRYGVLTDWLELRLATNFAGETIGSTTHTGAKDLYIGAKLGLTLQDGILPEMALVPQMTLPTGSSVFTNNEVLPGMNWLYGWDINDSLSAGGSTQFNRSVDESTDKVYTAWAQSLTAGFSLTDRLAAYTEWFAFFPSQADTAQIEHYADGGFTFLITNDIQWDIRAGLGLNAAAEDFFVGTGLSLRFR